LPNPTQRGRPPREPAYRPEISSRLHRLGLAPGRFRACRPTSGCREAWLRHHLPARPRQRPDADSRHRHKVWRGRGRGRRHAVPALDQGPHGRQH
ncbi:hypothetical protein BN1708_019666, partial [Verticillium longisporum]